MLLVKVESSRSDHQKQAQLLLERCMTAPGHQRTLKPSFRLAFSGPPGVGKSTFLDQLGLHIFDHDKKSTEWK